MTEGLPDYVKNNQFEMLARRLDEIKTIGEQHDCDHDYPLINNNEVHRAMNTAIEEKKYSVVKYFLNKGVSAQAGGYLHKAACVGNLPIVKLLVEQGYNFRNYKPGKYEFYSQDQGLRGAIKNGHTEVVEYLLNEGASVDGNFENVIIMDDSTSNFLGRAANYGHKKIVKLLIDKGADIGLALRCEKKHFKQKYERIDDQIKNAQSDFENEINGPSERLCFFTTTVIKKDRKKIIKKSIASQVKLLYRKKKVTFKKNKLKNAMALIFENAYGVVLKKCYNKSVSQTLSKLMRGVDISGFKFVGVSIGHSMITKSLLKTAQLDGADKAIVDLGDVAAITNSSRRQRITRIINSKFQKLGKIIDNGIPNLLSFEDAVLTNSSDTALVRISAGANPNQRTLLPYRFDRMCRHEGPLFKWAIWKKNLSLVKLFAEHPDINKSFIVSGIKLAKKIKAYEIEEYLKSSPSFSINGLSSWGSTLLYKAVCESNIEEIERLIGQGADVNIGRPNFYTPLMKACDFRVCSRGMSQNSKEKAFLKNESQVRLIRLLLDSGANPNLMIAHNTALVIALQRGFLSAVEILFPLTEPKDFPAVEDSLFHKPWGYHLIRSALYSHNSNDTLDFLHSKGVTFNYQQIYAIYQQHWTLHPKYLFKEILKLKALNFGGLIEGAPESV